MERERKKKLLLAGLGGVLVVALGWAWMRQSSVPLPASNGSAARAPSVRRQKSASGGPLDVHLKALGADRAKPGEAARNLFRFKPKPPPPPPPSQMTAAPQPSAPMPTGPPPSPQVPPIALKFIGLVQTADKSQRLAVLSDGRGSIPIYGTEGDIIDGRYRIVHIGTESIELAYLDGRGRQTIRLSGG